MNADRFAVGEDRKHETYSLALHFGVEGSDAIKRLVERFDALSDHRLQNLTDGTLHVTASFVPPRA
ncbi:MAG: hypothetical protein H6Q30_121 [Bacteroidetes bacterium]|jgi:nitrogen-specific signal transduction histidine kinase|nr:hypothetical protein [Bacteroidota bacterium]